MFLTGCVTGKNGAPIPNASVELKDKNFETLYQTLSDERGRYQLDVPPGCYPFLTAVKEYAVQYLEYWCQDIPLTKPLSLDVSFDRLEVYGLHAFAVKGAGNGWMAYCRPMSLDKFQQGKQDLAPGGLSFTALLDGSPAPILQVSPVKEVAGEQEMTAYLIQIQAPSAGMVSNKCELQIQDQDGNYGAAAIFHCPG